MAISVIIPTYKEPEHLELCLRSALETMVNKDNQILVYVDGTGDLEENQAVIKSFSKEKEEGYNPVIFMVASTNRGMCAGMNYAIRWARYRQCLVVNDDMVFPKNWDVELERHVQPRQILIPGVLEPAKSCYPDVETRAFGTSPDQFDSKSFYKESYNPELEAVSQIGMDRLPFLVDKYEYLALGGWDENCIHGLQADDEFFLKAKILGLETVLVPSIKFYHFSKASVNDFSLQANGKESRSQAFAENYRYLGNKWGGAFPLNVGMKQVCLIDIKTRQIII